MRRPTPVPVPRSRSRVVEPTNSGAMGPVTRSDLLREEDPKNDDDVNVDINDDDTWLLFKIASSPDNFFFELGPFVYKLLNLCRY